MEGGGVNLLDELSRVQNHSVHSIIQLTVPCQQGCIIPKADTVYAAISDVVLLVLFEECSINEAKACVVGLRDDACVVEEERVQVIIFITLLNLIFQQSVVDVSHVCYRLSFEG